MTQLLLPFGNFRHKLQLRALLLFARARARVCALQTRYVSYPCSLFLCVSFSNVRGYLIRAELFMIIETLSKTSHSSEGMRVNFPVLVNYVTKFSETNSVSERFIAKGALRRNFSDFIEGLRGGTYENKPRFIWTISLTNFEAG